MSMLMDAVLRYDGVLVNNRIPQEHAMRELPDATLVDNARTGDFSAFEELVRRHRNDVFRLSLHFVHNREEAWDLSQEVFIKVHRSLRDFRGESHFKAWLLRITANQCKDYLKKRRVPTIAFDERIQTEVPSPVLEPGRALEAEEIGNAIQAALQRLSHKHRTAFLLREFEGLSYEEMAQVMNCSVGTVMSRLHHARKKLQQSLIRMRIVEENADE